MECPGTVTCYCVYSWCVGPVHDQYIAQMVWICYGLKGGPTITRALPLPRTKGHVLGLGSLSHNPSEIEFLGSAEPPRGAGNGPDHDLRDREVGTGI